MAIIDPHLTYSKTQLLISFMISVNYSGCDVYLFLGWQGGSGSSLEGRVWRQEAGAGRLVVDAGRFEARGLVRNQEVLVVYWIRNT